MRGVLTLLAADAAQFKNIKKIQGIRIGGVLREKPGVVRRRVALYLRMSKERVQWLEEKLQALGIEYQKGKRLPRNWRYVDLLHD